MGLEDRDWPQETAPEREGRTWKRSERTTASHVDAHDDASIEPKQRPAQRRTQPHPHAQESHEERNRASPPPVSLAVLLFLCLSVAAAALYLYF